MELIKEIKSALEVHKQTKGSGRVTDVELYASMWLKSLVFKVEEMQKTMQDIHDKLNNGASHEFEETIQYCITKAFYALKGDTE